MRIHIKISLFLRGVEIGGESVLRIIVLLISGRKIILGFDSRHLGAILLTAS